MDLPFQPPIDPMLAKLSNEIPTGDSWIYEPKWDGFRALVFKSGSELFIQSRDMKPLDRYFPELVEHLLRELPERVVLDGEIVIAKNDTLDFDALLLRVHPAASRVAMLAKESPSSYVAFDCLYEGHDDLREAPQAERRARLEKALARVKPPIHVTPATTDRAVAQDWFTRFEGAGLDGVMAKAKSLVYAPGKRAMMKIKHQRTADCVVAGFRWYKDGKGELVGSLLLGLHDAEGKLHHVGICSAFKREVRAELVQLLAPLRENAKEGHPWAEWASFASQHHAASREQSERVGGGARGAESSEPLERGRQRRPGASSRWNRGKDLSWEPLRIERVCEVSYDHMQGTRFRHATHFQRWRPDKAPADCRYDQLEVTPAFEVAQIFGGADARG